MNSTRFNLVSLLIFLLFFNTLTLKSQTQEYVTLFETSNGTETPTYSEVIRFYKKLSKDFKEIEIREMGMTDSGYPLHLVIFSADTTFDFKEHRKNKNTLLINNGIHPGESDGIDATMLLFRDLALKKNEVPKNTIIATIPIYNIGGALNRNSGTRTNQNGPKEYGFRGNARNYDLNRDFIKSDTKNAIAFAEIFHIVKPDVFIDNHVSNGADYQYTLTHLFTQHNKLGGILGDYLHTSFQPQLEASLQSKKWDITPYVNVWGTTPDKGFSQFIDHPRYSTGYTTLWNTLGMMVETHMLKPYKKRVNGTYELMISMVQIIEKEGSKIKELRAKTFDRISSLQKYPVQWKVDTSKVTKIKFKGYEGQLVRSEVTGKNRLKYNREQPYTKEVNYQNYFKPAENVLIPKGYIIPKGQWQILEKLKRNQILITKYDADTTLIAEVYYIKSFRTKETPYEGHYLHSDTKVTPSIQQVTVNQGDFYVTTNQPGIRYVLETLEPEAIDSFFNWNFFDSILQQKEGFSAYVWEDKAFEILKENRELKKAFELKKKDSVFAKNGYQQLDWLHKQSDHYEKAHNRYPIYRILK
ncbi:M14 family metallopeptidase [Aquimarina sp. W85]|uniref:M14 family metallopeptidase n=1 Tax=Aquimarina rhodophyticola TaxID=3342246 RepID=UPI00366A6088